MESDNDAFILNLKVNSLASSNEVHDAILEEIIRLNRGEKESEIQIVGGKKSTCCSNRIPLANDLIQDVAVSPPYVGVLMKNGKVCRLKLLGENDEIELKNGEYYYCILCISRMLREGTFLHIKSIAKKCRAFSVRVIYKQSTNLMPDVWKGKQLFIYDLFRKTKSNFSMTMDGCPG